VHTADDTNSIVRKQVREMILNALTRIVNIIENGIANGELKASFDTKTFSIKMMTMIEGGTLIGRVLETNSQMRVIAEIVSKEIEEQLT
jgi:TetR/AcrR family transcriptional repressor of nem operon